MRFQFFGKFKYLFLLLLAIQWACDGAPTTGMDPTPTPGPVDPESVQFNPVGQAIDDLLIDLEFLPGQNGESIAVTQDGNVHYLRNDFTPLDSVAISVNTSGSEQGMLNVVADPLYATNHLIYFYFTVGGVSPPLNRVAQYEVGVDIAGGNFSLNNPQTIIEFSMPAGTDRHNGGSLVFRNQDELAIGVGEGTVAANAQSLANRLGKIHRIIPNRPGPGFTNPPDNPFVLGPPGAQQSIFAFGLRNPFTLVVDRNGALYTGDVGGGLFEEINLIGPGGINYGWPNCEGPCDLPNPSFVDPIHGFAHDDTTFYDQDPLPNPMGAKSIIVSAVYQGDQYGGLLTDKLIYNEFFGGWVRLATLAPDGSVMADQHLTHLEGLTGLHTNPADGLLYGVSLIGSDQILRLDLE